MAQHSTSLHALPSACVLMVFILAFIASRPVPASRTFAPFHSAFGLLNLHPPFLLRCLLFFSCSSMGPSTIIAFAFSIFGVTALPTTSFIF
jgi:hypothetical protein